MTKRTDTLTFKVFGQFAMFAQPYSSIGGVHSTYHIPTYDALRGICESIYWKPTVRWVIEQVRVLNTIQTHVKGEKPMALNGKTTLSYHTYLVDVAYEVKAHMIQNPDRLDLAHDFIPQKHEAIAKRSIKRGGRYDIFLGTRDCQAYVEPCQFGEHPSVYDDTTIHFGCMYHGIDYPTPHDPTMYIRFAHIHMENGIITFPPPSDCMRECIREHEPHAYYRPYTIGQNLTGVDVEDLNTQ